MLFYRQQTVDLPPIQRCAAGGDFTPSEGVENCRRPAAGNAGVHRREQKGTGHRMVSCPLLTPLTFLCADTSEMCSETGVREHDSGRLSAYGTLYCPEFTLRDLPRITVRGQTVQSVCVPLRKAPLPSSVDPWSTKRHCGPLAFRRATEGSRVRRKMRGS